jgi:hypothetical protein
MREIDRVRQLCMAKGLGIQRLIDDGQILQGMKWYMPESHVRARHRMFGIYS